MEHRQQYEGEVLASLAALSPGTTACPGVLANQLIGATFRVDARDGLLLMREIYWHLRSLGKLRFLQKGKLVPPGKLQIKGPFRLAPGR